MQIISKRVNVLLYAEWANSMLHTVKNNVNYAKYEFLVKMMYYYSINNKKINIRTHDYANNLYYDSHGIDGFPISSPTWLAQFIFYCISNNNYSCGHFIDLAKKIENNKWFDFTKEKCIGPNIKFDPNWRNTITIGLVNKILHEKNTSNFPVLADALEEAGVPKEHVDYMRNNDNNWSLADWFVWNIMNL